MARTKGAKDAKPRKKPAPRGQGGKFVKRADKTSASICPPTDTTERPPLPQTDFAAAIAAEMSESPSASPGEPGAGQTSQPTATPPQATFDLSSLTIDGLASAWQLPFWALGWILSALKVIPGPECVLDVGRRRAKDLAKPSYEIYRHYTQQYLGMNPENSVHVAAGVTALNGVGILPELTEAIVEARRKWAAQRRQQATQGQGSPASVQT